MTVKLLQELIVVVMSCFSGILSSPCDKSLKTVTLSFKSLHSKCYLPIEGQPQITSFNFLKYFNKTITAFRCANILPLCDHSISKCWYDMLIDFQSAKWRSTVSGYTEQSSKLRCISGSFRALAEDWLRNKYATHSPLLPILLFRHQEAAYHPAIAITIDNKM